MKYVRLFETTAEFEAVKDNLEKPWLTLIKDNKKTYNKGVDSPQPTYEMVDLGLPSGL